MQIVRKIELGYGIVSYHHITGVGTELVGRPGADHEGSGTADVLQIVVNCSIAVFNLDSSGVVGQQILGDVAERTVADRTVIVTAVTLVLVINILHQICIRVIDFG